MRNLTLFLCGDVMTGRGIDQVLPHPGDPRLFEPHARSAREYVDLAEAKNGPIPRPVAFSYPWGDALEAMRQADVRIVNLETSITTNDDAWPHKTVHYRMCPENISCLKSAAVDCCALANNHVMDWGRNGLEDTLRSLDGAGIAHAGAARDAEAAAAPAVLQVGGGGGGGGHVRVVVFAFGSGDSGIPPTWAAAGQRSGVHLLPDLSARTVQRLARAVRGARRDGDIVVASVHWGPNWGYDIADDHREFARRLVGEAHVDIVHGHSSHHPKGIEVFDERLILYGCGDFLNDYEGITGFEEFRGDLTLMYLPTVDPGTGRLVRLELTPLRLRQFRLERASDADTAWMRGVLNHECTKLGSRVEATSNGRLLVRWSSSSGNADRL